MSNRATEKQRNQWKKNQFEKFPVSVLPVFIIKRKRRECSMTSVPCPTVHP